MVQTISLIDTKELTPQKIKNTKLDTKNIDFLELLMKDIKTQDSLNTDKNFSLDKNTKDSNDAKESKDSMKEDMLDLDKIFNLKDLENNKDLKNLMQNEPQFKEDIIKEVKNILESKLKQNNILLSKSDEKKFKSIDNIKDLLKFADKKGLNVKSIKFEIPKETKENIKADILNTKQNKDIQKNSSKTTKFVDTKNILEKKQINKKNIDISKHQKKQTTKQINNTQSNKNISLENILNQTDNKVKNKTKHKNEKPTQDNIKNINILDIDNKQKKDIKKTETKKIDITHIKHNIVKDKEIDLSDLISPKKEIKTKSAKNDNIQNNINLNQTPINELKAKSVQAKQTIDSFKNNLDDAIKNYKPPISKVDIELNPKNLGKVEVTIIQRGNNIQVNMHTDQSNVALFQNHQAEFRQALSSIGFSNIDMSFNSSQEKERKQNQAKKAYKDNEKIEDIGDIEIKADYQYA